MVYQGAYHPNENLTVFQRKAAQRDKATGCDRMAERDAELPGQKRQGLLADLPQDAAWTTQCHSESRRPVLRAEIKRSSHSRVHGVGKAQGDPPRKPIVNDLLYSGTYLFVGAPKVGKSFFMGQLAYHVAMGLPLWEYEVHQGTVLYLALEDDYARLQRRLSRMFGVEETSNLYFATQAKSVSEGLDQQLEGFIREHPDVRLIIIDTLQKVREIGGDRYSYASDYEIVTRLKTFSDKYGICLLVVHHTRKMEAEDSFDMISGTNGLLGAADGAFIMQKKRRTDNTALLDIVGRDQPDQELTLEFDRERCVWEFQGAETELWKLPPDQLLEAVAKMLSPEQPEWSGTPTELLERLPGVSIQANILTRKLNVSADRLYNDYGIRYESRRTHEGRVVKLTLENSGA